MRVAIVHNHLNPGGVTRVIRTALAALADSDIRIAVLVGEPPPGDEDTRANAHVLPELRYEEQRARCSAEGRRQPV